MIHENNRNREGYAKVEVEKFGLSFTIKSVTGNVVVKWIATHTLGFIHWLYQVTHPFQNI